MAQIGTDIIELITVGQSPALVMPCNYTVVAVAPSLGTQGSTTSTLTLTKNGSNTSLAATVAASKTADAVVTGSVSGVAGDVLGVAAAYGTSALNGALTLQIQRA